MSRNVLNDYRSRAVMRNGVHWMFTADSELITASYWSGVQWVYVHRIWL